MIFAEIKKLNLNFILVPRTELIGDTDRYVKSGSTVVLRCVVRGAIEPPSYIIWYHGTQQILPDNKLGFRMYTVRSSGNDGSASGTGIMGNLLGLNSPVSAGEVDSLIDRQNTVSNTFVFISLKDKINDRFFSDLGRFIGH